MKTFGSIEERNEAIVDAWVEGKTYSQLTAHFSVSSSTIGNIIADAKARGIKRKKAPSGQSIYSSRPLSNLHAKLGNDIAYLRTVEHGLTMQEFCSRSGISRHKLVQIERGVADATLFELQRIARVFNRNLESLFKGVKTSHA